MLFYIRECVKNDQCVASLDPICHTDWMCLSKADTNNDATYTFRSVHQDILEYMKTKAVCEATNGGMRYVNESNCYPECGIGEDPSTDPCCSEAQINDASQSVIRNCCIPDSKALITDSSG